MKFIRALTETETQALRQLHKNGLTHRERQRAHALLLSAKGYTLEQLANIFDWDRNTLGSGHPEPVDRCLPRPRRHRPERCAQEQTTPQDRPEHTGEPGQTVRANPSPQVKSTLLQTLKTA
jgi:hypothetical protein